MPTTSLSQIKMHLKVFHPWDKHASPRLHFYLGKRCPRHIFCRQYVCPSATCQCSVMLRALIHSIMASRLFKQKWNLLSRHILLLCHIELVYYSFPCFYGVQGTPQALYHLTFGRKSSKSKIHRNSQIS